MSFRKIETLICLTKGKKPLNILQNIEDGYLPYVDIKAFETGIVDNYTDGEKCVSCNDGNLLIVCDGSRSGLVGKAVTGYVGSTLARIDASNEIDINYLYYFIQGKYQVLNTNVKGTGTPHLKQDLLKSFDIYLPSLDEQQRIVTKIEELFSKLDKGVEELNKIKEQLKIYRQAVLKEAYNLSNDKVKLENLCFFITKGTTPPKGLVENNTGVKEVPFLKVYNLTFDGQLDFSIDPTFVTKETHTGFLNRSICLPGDVLMNIVGPPIGKVSIVPNTYPEWNINQAIVRYRCLEKLNNKFLAYFLLFSNTVEQLKSKGKTTAGQFNLTLEICRELQIPLPTIEKQVEIVDCIEQKLFVCDKIEQTVNESLQKAESLRQSILKQAFEGKLV